MEISKYTEAAMNDHHFLILTYAAQGHLNPSLQLAKRIIAAGARVTFATTVDGLRQIKALPSIDGLSYASFNDGYDDGIRPIQAPDLSLSDFQRVSKQSIDHLLRSLSDEVRPVSFVIYNILLPWAGTLAAAMSIPSAFFCTHSATVFAIYYHCFNAQNGVYGRKNDGDEKVNEPPSLIEFEGLPPFSRQEIPSFLLPEHQYHAFTSVLVDHVRVLEEDPNPCILFNTFHALEEDSIKAIKFNSATLSAIGPLHQSAYLDNENPTPADKSLRCDLFDSSKEYIHWLNSKPDRSVVYVSFGSLATLKNNQMEEILNGLLSSGRPFLWVIRPPKDGEEGFKDAINDKLKEAEEEEKGLIVPWCSQLEVLGHTSVGCFVTHGGWNSTTEGLTAGIPMVVFPQFSDQLTNAKMVDEVWGCGVKVRVDEEGYAEREELRRCVEMVMGDTERGASVRLKAEKWRASALAAVGPGGSSDIAFRDCFESYFPRR